MIYGYARVSTEDQKLDLQTDALKTAGCEKIFTEKLSAAKERPALNQLLKQLKKGDSVVVWKLDRLGRSLRHLIDLVTDFKEKGVKFVSLRDNVDTATAHGRLIFNMVAMLAEFERDIIRERTNAGLASARARGKMGGRPEGLTKEAQITAMAVYHLYQDKSVSISDIVKQSGVSVATVYKYIRYIEAKMKKEAGLKEAIVKAEQESAPVTHKKENTTEAPKIAAKKTKGKAAPTKEVEKVVIDLKKGPTVISIKDATNMVDTGVADCSTEIIGTDGVKKLTVFNSVKEAIKMRLRTSSVSRIWIWNKETGNIMYVVGDDKKAL